MKFFRKERGLGELSIMGKDIDDEGISRMQPCERFSFSVRIKI